MVHVKFNRITVNPSDFIKKYTLKFEKKKKERDNYKAQQSIR